VEIRRLHEAFGITTLYVTHDQAEAMVISDRIAVIQGGRVAQVGTADELFDTPRSRFVAEFIGKTNLVDAVAVAPDTVERGGLRLRVAAAGLAPGARVTLSIRPHLIVLVEANDRGRNVLAGSVRRASFLGDAMDYEVEIAASDVVLRVTAPPGPRLRAGEAVRVRIEPGACLPLVDPGEGT